jgi:prepilin-type N-terminal cleavage/methylation domain-containing protein
MTPRTRDSSRSRGFTLVELLIALTIFGIVIAQAFAVFGAQHITYSATERSIEVQEDSRLLADAILGDIRMAGYMVPRAAGIGSIDGGATGPDAICISDPAAIQDSQVASAQQRFAGAALATALGSADGVANMDTATLDIDGNGTNDFGVGSGIIFADGDNSHCAVIDDIAGSTIQFTPDTPAGFSITSSSGIVTPAIYYELDGTDLLRNGRRLANGIEDLQVEFGVDTDGDGQLTGAEIDVDDLDGLDPTDVISVTLSVITRGDVEEENLQTPGRPAAANRAASGAADGFRRRRITATAVPRNLL